MIENVNKHSNRTPFNIKNHTLISMFYKHRFIQYKSKTKKNYRHLNTILQQEKSKSSELKTFFLS